MSHVRIDSDGLMIDGKRVPVLANDFKVDFREFPKARVTCTVVADVLDVDLPEAVLEVKQAGQEDAAHELRLIRALLEGINLSAERNGKVFAEAINRRAASGSRRA